MFRALLQEIRDDKTKSFVYLSGCEINDIEATELASTLRENGHIKNVYLSTNEIEDKGAEALASITTLDSLFLAGNSIGTKGIRALASSPLKRLDISDNEGTNDETLACFCKHPILIELIADECDITDKGAEIFAANPPSRLKKLSLEHNKLTHAGERALLLLPLDELNLKYNNFVQKNINSFITSIITKKTDKIEKTSGSVESTIPSKWKNKTNRQIHQQLIQMSLFKTNIELKKKAYQLASSTSRNEYCDWARKQLR